MASRLFEPLRLRGLSFRNRIVVSPMCQYSGEDGRPMAVNLPPGTTATTSTQALAVNIKADPAVSSKG